MATTLGQRAQAIPSDGLVIHLDAANTSSYPGTGTTWYDLSGNGNHFKILTTAYNSSGVKYMDFNGSYGCAKALSGSDVALAANNTLASATIICWTRVKNSTAEWRTLLRGLSTGGDHQIIIESGSYRIGMYDGNTGTGFWDSTATQNTLPNYGTSNWVMLAWRFDLSNSPYYKLTWNDSPGSTRGSISSAYAGFKTGICSIGAYNNGDQTNASVGSQYWGDIGLFAAYNRVLSDTEVTQCYNAGAPRFMGAAVTYEDVITYGDGSVQVYNAADINSSPSNKGKLIKVDTYATAGSFTWTKPVGCTKVLVKVVGGGGGGSGHCESGGGGGYAEKLVDVTNVNTVSITVGAGGAAAGYVGTTGGLGTNGGTSSFGSYCSATGGYGSNRNANHTGGHGGVGSGGDINLLGGSGTGHSDNASQQVNGIGGATYWGSGKTSAHNNSNPSSLTGTGSPGAGGGGANQGYLYNAGTAGAVTVHSFY